MHVYHNYLICPCFYSTMTGEGKDHSGSLVESILSLSLMGIIPLSEVSVLKVSLPVSFNVKLATVVSIATMMHQLKA